MSRSIWRRPGIPKIGAAGVAAGQTEELVRTIPMEPGGRLTLGNVSGEITVTGVDADNLTIRATKRVAGRGSATADALDRVEIDIEERGNRVIVETCVPTFPSSSAGATCPATRPSSREGAARFEGLPPLAAPA